MATIAIDNRGLEPPEPMVNILAALRGMADGDELLALMDRDPLLLYPELERRGFAWELADAGEYFELTIRRSLA